MLRLFLKGTSIMALLYKNPKILIYLLVISMITASGIIVYTQNRSEPPKVESVKTTPATPSLTVSQLFNDYESYMGKSVEITGIIRKGSSYMMTDPSTDSATFRADVTKAQGEIDKLLGDNFQTTSAVTVLATPQAELDAKGNMQNPIIVIASVK